MSRRKIKGLLLGLTAVILLVAGLIIFRKPKPAPIPSVDHVYYEPSYLPANVSIKAKRISALRGRYRAIEQNFRTEDWVYDITERKATSASSVGTANEDYDAKSIKPTCTIQKSPANMQYRVCHWIDYGRINVHEVIFIKDGTYIYSQIPTATDQEISPQEVGKYVDSFEPKSTSGIEILDAISPV